MGRQLWKSVTYKRGPYFAGTHAGLCEWLVLKSQMRTKISSHRITEKQQKGQNQVDFISLFLGMLPTCLDFVSSSVSTESL